MINVHYEKRIWKPFTTSFSNAVTASSFRRNHFNVTFTHWLENPSVWPLQDVITGILYTNCSLLNYLILIATLYLWGCRRNQTLPNITAFSSKVKIKYEKLKSICVKTNKMDKFNRRVNVGNENIQFLVKKWESFLFLKILIWRLEGKSLSANSGLYDSADNFLLFTQIHSYLYHCEISVALVLKFNVPWFFKLLGLKKLNSHYSHYLKGLCHDICCLFKKL